MTLLDKAKLFIFGLFSFFLIVGALIIHFQIASYQRRISDLQNQIAQKDKTIELNNGTFEKLTQTNGDLKSFLDENDKQLKELKKQLDQKNAEVLSVTQTSIKWKKAYESFASASQTEVKTDDQAGKKEERIREKVDFSKNFGIISVNGYTLTDPPEAYVKVQQERPLKLTLTVSQNSDGTWTSYATSSDENTQIDIGLSAVNPYSFSPRWYEKIGISGGISIGTDLSGLGLLSSLSLSYRLQKFSLGPKIDVLLTDRVSKFYGFQMTWYPFARAE